MEVRGKDRPERRMKGGERSLEEERNGAERWGGERRESLNRFCGGKEV